MLIKSATFSMSKEVIWKERKIEFRRGAQVREGSSMK